MLKKSPTTSEWQHLALNPRSDVPLYQSPRSSPETGLPVSRGTDLFVHRAPGGTLYFYLHHWSLSLNETNICQVTSADAAADFLREHTGLGEGQPMTGPGRTRVPE